MDSRSRWSTEAPLHPNVYAKAVDRQSRVRAPADVDARAKLEAERRALENPCRLQGCQILALHAADDPRHVEKKRKGKRLEEAEV